MKLLFGRLNTSEISSFSGLRISTGPILTPDGKKSEHDNFHSVLILRAAYSFVESNFALRKFYHPWFCAILTLWWSL